MKIVNTKQFKDLIIEKYPHGGIVFAETDKSYNPREVMITDGDFGATCLVPHEGEVFDWDWNINECSDDEFFAVYDNNDILQMIQNLTKCLDLKLEYDWE